MKPLGMPGLYILGLCAFVVACGGQPTEAGDEAQASRDEVRSGDSNGSEASAPEPGTAEYDRTKAAVAAAWRRTPVTGADPRPSLDMPVSPQTGVDSFAIGAVVNDPGCLARSLERNDDSSTGLVTLPFPINFFGTTYGHFFINNNGNVTFNAALPTYTPFTINARTPPIIAPFLADVDTRGPASSLVTYSAAPITFQGRPAFCVNWVNVGYYSMHTDKLNSFQLLLVDRGDTGVGNFDIVMNYDRVLWETGDASGGNGGFGGTPAGAGFSAGNGNPNAFFQFPGSLTTRALLDSNATTGLGLTSHNSTVVGRHIFGVRSGTPITNEHVDLNPTTANLPVGQTHTVTATLWNDQGQPVPNRVISFRVLSGPNANQTASVTSNAQGQASFTYVGSGGVGRDSIRASFTKTHGGTGESNTVVVDWTSANGAPVARCRNLDLVADLTCGASGSIDNGSSDPDGNLTGCVQSPAGPYGPGNTSVALTCTDSAGLSSSCTGTVTVRDTAAPSIQCPASPTAECVAGAATVTPGAASSSDNCGSPDVSNPGTASYPLGTTPVVYTATDSSGNASSCTVQVTVSDTRAPALALNGNPAPVLECGVDAYSEAGATATDVCAGNVPATASGSVNASAVGAYAVTYSASDASGNAAAPVTRTITVQDTLAPSITCPAHQAAECVAGGARVNPGSAQAQDACALGPVTQHGAATFPLGTTHLVYSAADLSGHSASCTTRVTVSDTQAPALVLNGDPAPVLECGIDTYAEAGATASDVCAGDVSGSISVTGAVNTGAIGTYALTYTAQDPSGHTSAAVHRAVSVQDTTAPALSLVGPSSLTLECGVDTYTEQGATAADACSGDLTGAIAISGSVNTQRAGTYALQYSVADGAGIAATQTRVVNVADTQAPQIELLPVTRIWPPNHTLRGFQLSDCATITDACGAAGGINSAGEITSISSDEPEDANGNGDGRTTGDIVITGSSSFEIRAEREGRGNGRVYTVNFTVTDAVGNAQGGSCQFQVPHSDNGSTAVDDGAAAGYTVTVSGATAIGQR
jgi:hypothetical protein